MLIRGHGQFGPAGSDLEGEAVGVRHHTRMTVLRGGLLAFLAAALLVAGFTGHAGVQVLDGAVAARIAALHLHGVPGEAEYVRTHHSPAPFVHPHCHKPLPSVEHQPDPDQVLAASALAGSAMCAALEWSPVAAGAALMQGVQIAQLPISLSVRPAVPPPQA